MKTFRQLLISSLPGSTGRIDCTETARETPGDTGSCPDGVATRFADFTTRPARDVLRAGRYNRVRVQSTLGEMRRSTLWLVASAGAPLARPRLG